MSEEIPTKDVGCCGSCGKPLSPKPKTCGRCKKPMSNSDKWYVDGCTIFHRNCDDPNSYKPQKKEVVVPAIPAVQKFDRSIIATRLGEIIYERLDNILKPTANDSVVVSNLLRNVQDQLPHPAEFGNKVIVQLIQQGVMPVVPGEDADGTTS